VAGAVVCTTAVTALACGGCTTAVEVHGPSRGPAECAALVAALPETVDGQNRREVAPGDALAAAWGDPAIVLRCGAPAPQALGPSSRCAEVNGVGWFAEQHDEGYRFSTIGRTTTVQMRVPYDYEPAADALVDVAAAIRQTVPEVQPCV
jgi:hypothetical protein